MDIHYIFNKTENIDKEAFAELLLKAKGERTMKAFAEVCGVNPSTFTRILQRSNKGASSQELLEAIAKNAAPNSGVTLEALAKANGYKIRTDIATVIDTSNSCIIPERHERQVRDILIQALVDRGERVSLGNISYGISESIKLGPDTLIMTDAFGVERGIWLADTLFFSENTQRKPGIIKRRAFDRIAKFVFISQSHVELFRPTRFSLVVKDKDIFDIIKNEFQKTFVPTEISIILVDILNGDIIDEFVLPINGVGYKRSYFMTKNPIPLMTDYLRADYDEEEFDE